MKVYPLKRHTYRPVGIVTGPRTVRGEWGGNNTWERVPRDAVLYAPSHREAWPLVERGEATARRWKYHGIISVQYEGWKITNLRGTLDGLTRDGQLSALIEWADFIRENGGNVGTPATANYSLWRSTLTQPVVEYGKVPPESLQLGGRQDMQRPGWYFDVELWDLSAAYASTIGTLRVPRKWVWKSGPGWNESRDGFARARVSLPRSMTWGPLPVSGLHKPKYILTTRMVPYDLSFPRDGHFVGVWTRDELLAAAEAGCDIDILESWHGIGAKPVFSEWWALMLAAREVLSPPAQRILKWAGNTLWGLFAASGSASTIWYDRKGRHREQEGRKMLPQSPMIAAQVAGKVRARLYREVLAPFDFAAFACHTDGAFTLAGLHPEPNGGSPGHWRSKKRGNLLLIGPQTYMLERDGKREYIMAGMTDMVRPRMFDRLARRMLKNGELTADTYDRLVEERG